MFRWERWHNQAKDFLSGAEYYLSTQSYNAALFSLHQSVESVLIAIIRSVLGYRVNNHNLSRLLKITEMFTGELVEVFNLEDEESAKMFDMLKHAYVNVRYKDIYQASHEDVSFLLPEVKKLMTKAAQVHKAHLSNEQFIIRF